MGKLTTKSNLRYGRWRGWVAAKTREYVAGGANRNAPDLVERMAVEGVPLGHPELAWREAARQEVTKTLKSLGYIGVPKEDGSREFQGEQLTFDGLVAWVKSQFALAGSIKASTVARIEQELAIHPDWALGVADVLDRAGVG